MAPVVRMQAVAGFVARHARLVVLVWAAAAVPLFLFAPRFDDVVTRDEAAFLADDAPSVTGGKAFERLWPADPLVKAGALVFRRSAGLTNGDRRFIDSVEAWLHSDDAPEVVDVTQSATSRPELADALLSEDGKVAIVVVGFTTPPFQPETDQAVLDIRGYAQAHAPDGLEVHLTGPAGVAADQAFAIDESVHRTTLITLGLVTAILLWVYRSPVAPLVPLFTVGVALVVSRGLISFVADAGLQISSLVETFMVVIVFGAGTDYCLFIVSRFKEELAGVAPGAGEHRRTLVGTMAIVGAVIASSAATVIVGFMSQGVAEFGLYRTTGPAMAIAVLVTLLAGLTLTPALLSLLGRRAFWPWRAERAARAVPAIQESS